MKRLVLVLNGKGGVGKSFFAVNFVQFLKDQSIAQVAIDSDNENSTLKRFHPDAQFLDLSQRRELDAIFQVFETTRLVVVDCRAASTDLFLDYFTEIDLPTILPALGIALTLVMPVNHELDSVDQLQRLAARSESRRLWLRGTGSENPGTGWRPRRACRVFAPFSPFLDEGVAVLLFVLLT